MNTAIIFILTEDDEAEISLNDVIDNKLAKGDYLETYLPESIGTDYDVQFLERPAGILFIS